MDKTLSNGMVIRNVPDNITETEFKDLEKKFFSKSKDRVAPNGQVVRNVPNTVTDEEFQAAFTRKNPTFMEQLTAPLVSPKAAEQVVRGGARGVMDIGQGAVQRGSTGLNEAGIISDDTNQAVQSYVDQSLNNVSQEDLESPAFVTSRVVGQAATLLPLSKLRFKSDAVIPRVASNAAQGGIAGMLMPTREGESASQNTMIGALTGAAVPEIIRGILAAGGYAGSWIQKKFGERSAGAIRPTDTSYGELSPDVVAKLKASGIDWDNLPDRVKKSTFNWFRQNAGKTELTPVEAGRLGLFEGVPSSKAMITRDTMDYNHELDLARQPGGREVRDTYTRTNEGIGTKLEMEGNKYQGTSNDKTLTGERAVGVLTEGSARTKKVVDDGYKFASADPNVRDKISMSKVRQFLDTNESDLLSDKKSGDLAAGLKNELKRMGAYGDSIKTITVKQAEQLREWLGKQWQPDAPMRQRMIMDLRDVIDETVLSTGKGSQYEGPRKAYQIYRETYRDKKLIRDLLTAANDVDRKVATIDVFDRIIEADPPQIENLLNTLRKGSKLTTGPDEAALLAKGEEAIKDIQTTLLKHIADKSQTTSRGQYDTPLFSYDKMNTVINKIGKERLNVILGEEGRKELVQVLEMTRLAKPLAGIGSSSQGHGNRIWNFFKNYFPRMGGGAVGVATTGNPLGAAAGAAVGEATGSAVINAGVGRQSRLASNAEKAINVSRRPSIDWTGAAPRGWVVPPATNALREE